MRGPCGAPRQGAWSTAPSTHTASIARPGRSARAPGASRREGRGGGAEARGTYRVMVRERAELVRGVQAGEVSGVGLQQEEKGRSAAPSGTLTKLGAARLPHQHRLSARPHGPARPHTFLRRWDPCATFPRRALGQPRV